MPEAPGSWYSLVMMPSILVHSRAQEDVALHRSSVLLK